MLVHPADIGFVVGAVGMPLQRLAGGAILLAAVAVLFLLARPGRAPRLFGWRIALPTQGQALAQAGDFDGPRDHK